MLGSRGVTRGTAPPLSGRKTQSMGKKSPHYVTVTILCVGGSCWWTVGPCGHTRSPEPWGPVPLWLVHCPPPCGFFLSRATSVPADGCPFHFPEKPSPPPACHLHDLGDVSPALPSPRVCRVGHGKNQGRDPGCRRAVGHKGGCPMVAWRVRGSSGRKGAYAGARSLVRVWCSRN